MDNQESLTPSMEEQLAELKVELKKHKAELELLMIENIALKKRLDKFGKRTKRQHGTRGRPRKKIP